MDEWLNGTSLPSQPYKNKKALSARAFFSSETFLKNFNDFLTTQHLIAALEEERSIGDAIDPIFCRAELGDLHGKAEFLHPIFHGLDAFLGNLLIRLAFRVDLPEYNPISF